MLTPQRVPAVCAWFSTGVLLLAGCGAPDADTGEAAAALPNTGVHADGSDTERSTAHFGNRYEFDTGITVAVSEPTSFQPGTSAYPQTEHALAFQLTVDNETDHQYRLSEMRVTVTVDDSEASQITDRTQGYTGLTDSQDDLPSDEKKRVSLAFAVPEHPRRLTLTVEPDADDSSAVTYVGSRGTSGTRAR